MTGLIAGPAGAGLGDCAASSDNPGQATAATNQLARFNRPRRVSGTVLLAAAMSVSRLGSISISSLVSFQSLQDPLPDNKFGGETVIQKCTKYSSSTAYVALGEGPTHDPKPISRRAR